MKIQIGAVLQGRWKLAARLSTGTYSKIYLAYSAKGNQYAIKVDETFWITDEKKIYDILHSAPTSPTGIARIIGHGYEEEHGFLVLPRLGVSIHHLWVMCQRRFTHATIAKIAVQAIQRLEFVHSRGIVHGDIVSKNFVMGSSGDERTVYLIDFGNAKQFTDEISDGVFVPKEGCDEEACPRADLRALARMLVKLHRDGNHTWLKENEPMIERRGLQKYLSCLSPGPLPSARAGKIRHYWEYMRYVDEMETTKMPDYRFLKSVFIKFLDSVGETDNGEFQWKDLKSYKASLRMSTTRRKSSSAFN